MVLVSLLSATLIPIFGTLKIKFNRLIPSIFFITGFTDSNDPNSINLNSMPTAEHPSASDITYLINEDSNKAYLGGNRHAVR